MPISLMCAAARVPVILRASTFLILSEALFVYRPTDTQRDDSPT